MSKSPLYPNLEKIGMVTRIYLDEDETEQYKNVGEAQLPDDIYTEKDENGRNRYWRYPVLESDEINTRLAVFNTIQLQDLSRDISTIEKCVGFLTALAVVGVLFFIGFLIR